MSFVCYLTFFSYLCPTNTNNKRMKRIIPLFFAALVIGGFTSCGEKKRSDVIIAPKPQAPKPKKTQKMSEYEQSRDVEWLGTTYKVVMKREVDTSLPLAVVDDNTKYFDNKITVKILRKDGTEFFNRTFLKTDFNQYLDRDTKENGALLGLVFDKVEGNQLVFAASVGSPDAASDEYVPMVVKISRMGTMSIGLDTQLDTGSDEDSGKPSASPSSAADEDGV